MVYSEPKNFVILTVILFGITFLRYLLFSGLYHYVFFILFENKFKHRFINKGPINRKQAWMEIRTSAITSLVFALAGSVLFVLWQEEYTFIYLDWDKHSLAYLPLSLFLALMIHETYYYWLHRWMHYPKVYRLIHKKHHDSIETNSLTSFSFHPIESFLQAVILIPIILWIPMHAAVLLLFLIIMTISGTINHAGVEVYPSFFNKNWITKWLIGATHHDIHHKKAGYNFGLYFTFWDRWMGTEEERFDEKFERITGKASNSKSQITNKN
jgi:sterol desaturase/sphingolipid hydroxylase (fatty acid hydroxylase superfamily)